MMKSLINDAVNQTNQIILGKEHQIRLALACLFARGHLLIEDLPGMGKTTLSHALAKTLGLSYNRIQFTSDLLPADILGASIFNKEQASFQFLPGPIFSQVVLADEINRATPKAQSALLEAMEERQVTIEGETRKLPKPFFVIATQNPATQAGTFPLPESQLDRFLMRIQLGYPDPAAEREILLGKSRYELLKELQPVISTDQLQELQKSVTDIHASDSLLDYIQRIVELTRESTEFRMGISPRGSLAILRSAQSWALMDNRNHVVPEDVQQILPAVVEHRLNSISEMSGSALAQRILASVDVIR